MWFRRLGGTAYAGVSPLASAVFPSSCTSSFSPDIRRFLLFVLYCPVRGKVVGINFLEISTVRGGIAFLVEEETPA